MNERRFSPTTYEGLTEADFEKLFGGPMKRVLKAELAREERRLDAEWAWRNRPNLYQFIRTPPSGLPTATKRNIMRYQRAERRLDHLENWGRRWKYWKGVRRKLLTRLRPAYELHINALLAACWV